MVERYFFLFIILFIFQSTISNSKTKNSIYYPYGGVPDTNRFFEYMTEKPPINFNMANFDSLIFFEGLNLKLAQFNRYANFSKTKFLHSANFYASSFFDKSNFYLTYFYSSVNFCQAKFYKECSFILAHFDSIAWFGDNFFPIGPTFYDSVYFNNAHFCSECYFRHTTFNKNVEFREVKFDTLVSFENVHFSANVDFSKTYFGDKVDFHEAKFDRLAYFELTCFNNKVDFNSACFNGPIYFVNAIFDSSAIVDFSLAEIKWPIYVGIKDSPKIQRYDLLRAKLLPAGRIKANEDTTKCNIEKWSFYPGAKIILFGPVDLKIQYEKLKFIQLCDTLDYFSKKDIIDVLKEVSFKDEKYSKERTELDYLFAKSTFFQKVSVKYEKYSMIHPRIILNLLYDITMGLGFQPLKIIFLIPLLIFVFSSIYYSKFPKQINFYINDNYGKIKTKNFSANQTKFSTFLNCLFFSTMILLTIRLKGNILTHFDDDQKKIIIYEWLLGFSIIVAFFAFSKVGVFKEIKDNLPI